MVCSPPRAQMSLPWEINGSTTRLIFSTMAWGPETSGAMGAAVARRMAAEGSQSKSSSHNSTWREAARIASGPCRVPAP